MEWLSARLWPVMESVFSPDRLVIPLSATGKATRSCSSVLGLAEAELRLRVQQAGLAANSINGVRRFQGHNSWKSTAPYILSEALHVSESLLTLDSFSNYLWLLLNDAIMGYAFGSYLCEQHVAIGAAVADWLHVSFTLAFPALSPAPVVLS